MPPAVYDRGQNIYNIVPMEQILSSGWLRDIFVLGNTPFAYLCATVAFGAALALLYLLKSIGINRLKAFAEKTETDLDDLVVELLEKITPFEYYIISFYVASRYLLRTEMFEKGLNIVILVVFSFRAATIMQRLVAYWIEKAVTTQELSQEAKDSVMNGARVILKALVWVAAALFVLDNMGIDVTTVLTGLGIGGVAVALAAQAILGDLFNFFVILLDKPFKTGDFIVFEDIEGTIEHIGLKSIRIRSISGELIVVSNSKLLSAGLRNYNQMTRRRVAFKLGLVYQTPPAKLRRVPELVKTALTAAGATYDRCNLCNCADSAIEYEAVYYIENADYAAFARTREEILLKILEAFAAEGLDFAYPTQTLFVNKTV